MAISESALAPSVNINFTQIFLQHFVCHTFLHQSLGHHNFIFELSGIIRMILEFIFENFALGRAFCQYVCARRKRYLYHNNLTACYTIDRNPRNCGPILGRQGVVPLY